MLKRIVAMLAVGGFALGLTACNTIAGMGKDVSATGQAVEKAADQNKPY